MTQYFAYQQFRLWRAPLATRVLLSLFNIMILIATAIGILMYRVRTRLTVLGAQQWYRGNEMSAKPGEELMFARSLKEMLDVTHPHAFSQTFLFFILCHIFALTRVSDRIKVVVYAASFSSVAIDLAVPYLIRFVSPGFAALQIFNYMLMTASIIALFVVPMYEMWFYKEKAIR